MSKTGDVRTYGLHQTKDKTLRVEPQWPECADLADHRTLQLFFFSVKSVLVICNPFYLITCFHRLLYHSSTGIVLHLVLLREWGGVGG